MRRACTPPRGQGEAGGWCGPGRPRAGRGRGVAAPDAPRLHTAARPGVGRDLFEHPIARRHRRPPRAWAVEACGTTAAHQARPRPPPPPPRPPALARALRCTRAPASAARPPGWGLLRLAVPPQPSRSAMARPALHLPPRFLAWLSPYLAVFSRRSRAPPP